MRGAPESRARARLIAAVDKHMPDRYLVEHLAEKIVQIAAMREAGKIGFVSLLELFQIDAVQVRVIKEIALNPPRLAVHLLPFLARIHKDFHLSCLQFAFARLQRL